MIRVLFLIIVVAGLAFGIALSVTEELKDRIRSRKMSYFLCVVFVFVGAIVGGSMAADPSNDVDEPIYVSPMERERMIVRMFLISLLPALVGVRVALGKPSKPEPKTALDE